MTKFREDCLRLFIHCADGVYQVSCAEFLEAIKDYPSATLAYDSHDEAYRLYCDDWLYMETNYD